MLFIGLQRILNVLAKPIIVRSIYTLTFLQSFCSWLQRHLTFYFFFLKKEGMFTQTFLGINKSSTLNLLSTITLSLESQWITSSLRSRICDWLILHICWWNIRLVLLELSQQLPLQYSFFVAQDSSLLVYRLLWLHDGTFCAIKNHLSGGELVLKIRWHIESHQFSTRPPINFTELGSQKVYPCYLDICHTLFTYRYFKW